MVIEFRYRASNEGGSGQQRTPSSVDFEGIGGGGGGGVPAAAAPALPEVLLCCRAGGGGGFPALALP